MRLLLVNIAFLCIITFRSNGQVTLNLSTAQIEAYVGEIYGESFVNSNPTLVVSLGKLLNNRIEFRQEGQNENEKYPLLSAYALNNKNNATISGFTGLFNISTFNPLRYGFDFFSDKTQIIRIDGSDLLMIVHPQI